MSAVTAARRISRILSKIVLATEYSEVSYILQAEIKHHSKTNAVA